MNGPAAAVAVAGIAAMTALVIAGHGWVAFWIAVLLLLGVL